MFDTEQFLHNVCRTRWTQQQFCAKVEEDLGGASGEVPLDYGSAADHHRSHKGESGSSLLSFLTNARITPLTALAYATSRALASRFLVSFLPSGCGR